MAQIPLFTVRVRLPSSAAYHSGPSGDTEYEEAYHAAMKEAMPEGYEPTKLRPGQTWPKDNEGFTWVSVKPREGKEADVITGLQTRVASLTHQLSHAKSLAKQIADLAVS